MFVERIGRGPEVMLLHGWALHGGIWDSLVSKLRGAYRLSVPDLPGHGRSGDFLPLPQTVEGLAEACLRAAPPRAVWVGWSLGALVALEAARRAPARVTKLVLVGATARFTRAVGWNCAVAPEVLAGFAADLERDGRGTLQRFVSLQAAAGERQTLRRLRAELWRRGVPSAAALRAGLEVLAGTDLREQLPAIRQEALVLHGGRDRIVPVEAGEYLAARLPNARRVVIAPAGHAPFLSHESEFLEALGHFLEAGRPREGSEEGMENAP